MSKILERDPKLREPEHHTYEELPKKRRSFFERVTSIFKKTNAVGPASHRDSDSGFGDTISQSSASRSSTSSHSLQYASRSSTSASISNIAQDLSELGLRDPHSPLPLTPNEQLINNLHKIDNLRTSFATMGMGGPQTAPRKGSSSSIEHDYVYSEQPNPVNTEKKESPYHNHTILDRSATAKAKHSLESHYEKPTEPTPQSFVEQMKAKFSRPQTSSAKDINPIQNSRSSTQVIPEGAARGMIASFNSTSQSSLSNQAQPVVNASSKKVKSEVVVRKL